VEFTRAAGERRISELETQLALAVEESASLKDHIKSLEGKVLEITNLKHQVELSEHCYTQAQKTIKVKVLTIHGHVITTYKCE
jgi:phage shock protein A